MGWASRPLRLAGAVALPAIVSLLARDLEETALAALVMPSVLYAGLIVSAADGFVISRLLGIAAASSIAPALHAARTGAFDPMSALLWLSLALFLIAAKRSARALVHDPAPDDREERLRSSDLVHRAG